MKLLIVLALIGFAVARPEDYFKYDPAALQEAKDNPRLLGAYSDCVLGKGPCTKEGNELKKLIPDAISSTCGKCSQNDKVTAATILKALQNKHPNKFEALAKQYDPTGARRSELDQFISQNAS